MAETLDAKQVANLLGIAASTWRKYRSEGRGPEPAGAEIRDGRPVQVWDRDAVVAWHESRRGPGWHGSRPEGWTPGRWRGHG